jgi:hypothetical protein
MKIANSTESGKPTGAESTQHTVSAQEPSPQQLVLDLESYIQQATRDGKPLHEVEPLIFESVLRLGHAYVDQFLALQGNGDLGETVRTADGHTLHRSDEPVERPLRTVFGVHTIHAYVYSPGTHRAIELRAVDARLQLPVGRCSYLFEEFSQYFCVDQAFGQAARGIELVLRQKVSVDTLEHINRRVAEQATEFLDQLPTPPAAEEGAILVETGDGKGVPLLQHEAERLPVFDTPERPGNRRMATVVSVYSVDPYVRTPQQIVAALFRDGTVPQPANRPAPQFKNLRARFAQAYDDGGEVPLWVSGPIEAFSWAAMELQARHRAGQAIVRLMDGQPSLWNAAEASLDRQHLQRGEIIDILDILHVSSYVWRAAKVFHASRAAQERFARDRLLRILQGEVRGVIAGWRRMATQQNLGETAQQEIATVCGYFEENLERMRYDEYLRAGYPIATGVIEGACRHLVKDRMERSGMHWTVEGAQAMLEVRAVYQSNHWKTFQTSRIIQEQARLHPHRALIAADPTYALAA